MPDQNKMNPKYYKQPNIETLKKAVQTTKSKGLPPVHLWNPPYCGKLDIRIARDGTWFYLGTPIGRPQLVKLFSSILKREGMSYFLVTPVEKVGITVDDAPFVAVDFDKDGEGKNQHLIFTTQTDDKMTASAENPIRFDNNPKTGEPTPYIVVRHNLEALIDRKSFYRLVDIATISQINGQDFYGVWSQNIFFPITAVKDIKI